jgi:hypothetical protein
VEAAPSFSAERRTWSSARDSPSGGAYRKLRDGLEGGMSREHVTLMKLESSWASDFVIRAGNFVSSAPPDVDAASGEGPACARRSRCAAGENPAKVMSGTVRVEG